jgi:hypothetical protein
LPLLAHSLSEHRCCASPPTAVVDALLIFTYRTYSINKRIRFLQ